MHGQLARILEKQFVAKEQSYWWLKFGDIKQETVQKWQLRIRHSGQTYLLTYLLHGAGYYLKSWLSLSLSKKYPAFLWNPKVHYRVHTSQSLDPSLSQLNPVRPIDPYLPKIHFNVILPPTPRSSQWSLAFGPPNQNSVNKLL
jgi:hypothetical protein